AGELDRTHQDVGVRVFVGDPLHMGDRFTNGIVERLDLAVAAHRSGAVGEPDEVQRARGQLAARAAEERGPFGVVGQTDLVGALDHGAVPFAYVSAASRPAARCGRDTPCAQSDAPRVAELRWAALGVAFRR